MNRQTPREHFGKHFCDVRDQVQMALEDNYIYDEDEDGTDRVKCLQCEGGLWLDGHRHTDHEPDCPALLWDMLARFLET